MPLEPNGQAEKSKCGYQAKGSTSLRCAECLGPLMSTDAKHIEKGPVCPSQAKRARAVSTKSTIRLYSVVISNALVLGLPVGVALQLLASKWILRGGESSLLILAGPVIGGVTVLLARLLLHKSNSRWAWVAASIATAFGVGVGMLTTEALLVLSNSPWIAAFIASYAICLLITTPIARQQP